MLGAAGLVELRHRVLQFQQARLTDAGHLLRLLQLALQIHQLGLVRGGQGVAVSAQALASGVKLARLLLNAALVGGQHLDLLLHLGHTGTLVVGALLGNAQGILQVGQGLGLLFDLGGEHLGFFLTHHGQL